MLCSWTKWFLEAFFALLPFVAFVVFLSKSGRHPFYYRSVAILVLGDIGRSPRMMYHSESFAEHSFETFVIGYRETEPPASLRSLPRVYFLGLTQFPKFISNLPRYFFLIVAPLKVLFQIIVVVHTLFFRLPYTPQYIIVQNPPAIPTLAIVQLFVSLRNCKLIIDWHNLGYSILSIRLGENSKVVKIARWFERRFGKNAYAHLFVTKAMRDYLVEKWDLRGRTAVLHDRPPSYFHPASPAETHELMNNFPILLPPITSFLPPYETPTSTPFTHIDPSSPSTLLTSAPSFTPLNSEAFPVLRLDRPALVVTSTSWTADEDFDMLIEALGMYERAAKEVNNRKKDNGKEKERLPKVMMLVTGRGENRDKYMERVVKLEVEEGWEWVRCRSVWLSSSAYPILLGSADLGVSLHSSSSGLDLPMKVVDMFGCGLPVCALDFQCLDELVKEGVNGVVFRTASELAAYFERLLVSFPNGEELETLQTSLRESVTRPSGYTNTQLLPAQSSKLEWGTWSENWHNVVRPLVMAEPRYR